MGLSQPVRRTLNHTREYKCCGYDREDGLFDIEVEMTDVKPYSFDNHDRGFVSANEPLHHMHMRVTLDDEMVIRDIEAVTMAGPYDMCPAITDNYKRLVGVRVAPGFTKACRDATAGVEGCTHHNDILRILGTVAFQSMWPALNKKRKEQETAAAEHNNSSGNNDLSDINKLTRPMLLNSCHTYAPSSPVVKRQWPEFYQAEDRKSD